MKIGIVTYWKSTCNYGEQLQNYALQEYLRKLGHEPFLIRYDYEADTIYGSRPLPVRILRACNPKRLAGFFRSRRENRLRRQDSIDHPRRFEEFRQENLSVSRIYGSIDDLRNDPPEADLYITGSDQVWNTFGGSLVEMKNRYNAFFLDFGSESVKRVSYAASWGRNVLPAEDEEYIEPLLARLDVVSVREESGIDVCRMLGRDDAVLAWDPVILHDAEVYRKLYQTTDNDIPQEKYLLLYYLGTDGYSDKQAVFEWAASRDLKVIYVTDDWNDTYDRTFPTVTQWLELIDRAEYVVTNSYHCSLLALIFGKKFGAIRREGALSGMNTRMDTLFRVLGIEPRFVNDKGMEILEREAERLPSDASDALITPADVIEAAVKPAAK